MIVLEFSPEIIDELHYNRFYHPHPRVQLKMEAIYLRSQGKSPAEVCLLCRVSKWTLINYSKVFRDGGIEALKLFNCKGKKSELDEYTSTIKAEFESNPPRTAAEAARRIEDLTGVKRKLTQIKAFLRRNGFKRRKLGPIPAKAVTPEKQAEQSEFLGNELKPRLEEAKQGKRAVFFWMQPTSFTERF